MDVWASSQSSVPGLWLESVEDDILIFHVHACVGGSVHSQGNMTRVQKAGSSPEVHAVIWFLYGICPTLGTEDIGGGSFASIPLCSPDKVGCKVGPCLRWHCLRHTEEHFLLWALPFCLPLLSLHTVSAPRLQRGKMPSVVGLQSDYMVPVPELPLIPEQVMKPLWTKVSSTMKCGY